jgi:two-component system, NtrC family, sensor kinase
MASSQDMPPVESASGELRFDQNTPDSNWFNGVMLTLASFPEPVLAADRHGRLMGCNVAAKGLLGFGQEMGERGVIDLIRLSSGSVTGSWIDLCVQQGAIMEIPVIVHTLQGQEIPMTISANLVKGPSKDPIGCLAILRVTADGAQPPLQTREQMAMLSSILENFPTPFFTVDSHLAITHMNQLMEKLTGYSRDEVVNRMTCASVLSTAQCNTCDCLLKQAMESRQPISGVRRNIVDRNGKQIPVVINASLITDADGNVIGGFEAVRDITPIAEAEQKILLLTEMTQEGIMMVDQDLRVTFANTRMSEILDQTKEGLLGMQVAEVLPAQLVGMIEDVLHRVDREHSEQLRFCSTVASVSSQPQHRKAFETCMAAAWIGNRAISCLYFRDLSQRIEIEDQLRKANSFLENIIRSSVDGIVVVDTEGNVLLFNEGAENILGYRAEDVIGHREVFQQFYNPDLAREIMRRMRSDHYGPPGKLSTTRVTFIRKDGEEVPVNFSAAIIQEGGRELGSVGIFSDMREQLRIRRELEQARIQLMQTEKIASLGRLAAGVAHEINNPLAGILIYADMLMKDLSDHPQWSQDMQEIIDQTLRCKQIVTRLLEFSRQPLGQRIAFNPNDLLDRCVELLSHQPLFHDVEVLLDLQSDLPEIVGDTGQIQQVFTNIIINAANAMEGKGRLTISSRFNPQESEILLSFADTGPGVPEEIRGKIFEPFFTTKRPGEGTGLGLSVVYGIVQQHGGDIQVENSPLGGAVFTVNLPLESPEPASEILEYGSHEQKDSVTRG